MLLSNSDELLAPVAVVPGVAERFEAGYRSGRRSGAGSLILQASQRGRAGASPPAAAKDKPGADVHHRPSRHSAAALGRRHGGAAGLQKHLEPGAAAGGAGRGPTTVHDLLASDDTGVMLDALRQLGCGRGSRPAVFVIDGPGRALRRAKPPAFSGQRRHGHAAAGGSAGGTGRRLRTARRARMRERPIGDLVDALRQLGCRIDYLGRRAFRRCASAAPALRLDTPIQVRGDVSSQFLTALLMALPLVAAPRRGDRGHRRTHLRPTSRSRSTCCGASASRCSARAGSASRSQRAAPPFARRASRSSPMRRPPAIS